MTRQLALLAATVAVALGLVAAGCGGGGEGTTTATTATTGGATTTTPTERTTVRAFFFRRAALVPVEVEIPRTPAVARAALERLLEGPPAGYESAIPTAVRLTDVTIENGLATATFSAALGAPPRTAQAQIVSTLAQFPSVRAVAVRVEGEGPVPLENGAAVALDRPATPEDYADLTADAAIFVETPRRGATVSSPVRASGTANVFEATFQVEIWSGDRLLRTEVITASSGTGERGTWEATLEVPRGPARLVFYDASAKDGSHLHVTTVPIVVR